jgi:hypothetical protein
MAKVRITKRDGSSTPYFWSDRDRESKNRKTVYKQTADGVKRMKGVRFDPLTNRMHKD